MNIALLIDTLVGGGAEGVVQRLAGGLAHRGHRAFVYCLKTAGTPVARLQAAGVVVREAESVGRDPLLAWRLARWFHADRIEVAHAHNCAAMAWALPATKLRAVPLIHVRHGSLLGRPTWYRRLADRLDYLADRVVVVSESDRAELPAGRLARRAVRIPNGIDLEPMEPRESRTFLERLCQRRLAGPVVLGVGTICAEKDVCGLLRAFEILRRDVPDATLVWVGPERDPDYARRARHERDTLGLTHSVIFTGPVENAWRLMAGADVFCLSSATEAMPNVVVEAMSQRVPVVATAVGDVGRFAPGGGSGRTLIRHGETGLLVPPRNPQAMAEALRQALEDRRASRQRAARAAADYARFYTGEQMVRRYERVYTECVRRRGCVPARRPRGPRAPPRPGVLMVGPGAEQIGGMTSVIDTLMASSLREKYRLYRFCQTSAPPAEHRLRERGGIPGALQVLSAAARHAAALYRLACTVRRKRISIVHIHTCSFSSFHRSLADLLIVRLLGRRAYLHIHGAKFDEFCSNSGRCARRLLRLGCEAADGVIVLSRHWLETLREYLGKAHAVAIPNAVPSASTVPVRSSRGDDVCRFLFLGALTERKGLAELIEAAARMRRSAARFELILTGPVPRQERQRWEHAVRSSNLEQTVRLTGPVRGAAKAELLASVDCLVLPSHNEGLPVAILEAAMAGLPVIATTVGSIPDFMTPDDRTPTATNGGFLAPLVPPHDPAALAREMARLAGDPKLRRAIGARLRMHAAANYSVERQAERIARLYEASPVRHGRSGGVTGKCTAPMRHSTSAWIVGRLTYPLHEALRGRPTLAYLSEMGRIAAEPEELVQRECAARLRNLLRFASDRLPYYRELFAKYAIDPHAADPYAELSKLPVIEKADVRANAERMLYREVPGGLIPCGSGGTSGDTLHFFIDRNRQAQPLACRLFMQGLFGVRPGDRRVYLWGSPIETGATRLKRWRDRLVNELLLDAFELGPAAMDRHLAAIRSFQPRLIYAYPSAAALLAKRAAKRYGPRDFPWLRLVVLTGEEVTPDQVRQVRQTFGCAVASEYGSREVGLIAHECPHGSLHIMSPHIRVEIARDGQPAAAGQVGEVLCTTLTTRAQPFIRYRVGDAGALLAEPCACGLPFPRMRIAGGKITGFVVLRDGRLCHGAVSSYALRDELGIVEFKTFQRAIDRFEVLLVVDQRFDRGALARIQRRYRALFGPQVQVDCQLVDRIPPDPSGKRRHVVSDIAPDYADFEVVPTLEPEKQPAEMLP